MLPNANNELKTRNEILARYWRHSHNCTEWASYFLPLFFPTDFGLNRNRQKLIRWRSSTIYLIASKIRWSADTWGSVLGKKEMGGKSKTKQEFLFFAFFHPLQSLVPGKTFVSFVIKGYTRSQLLGASVRYGRWRLQVIGSWLYS